LRTVSFNFSENTGQKLENLLFLYLLQSKKGYKLFYHSGGKSQTECDFLIMKETFVSSAIQVSSDIRSDKTKNKEISGLIDALNEYKLKKGYILTMDSYGKEEVAGKDVIIIPAWKYMLYPDLYP